MRGREGIHVTKRIFFCSIYVCLFLLGIATGIFLVRNFPIETAMNLSEYRYHLLCMDKNNTQFFWHLLWKRGIFFVIFLLFDFAKKREVLFPIFLSSLFFGFGMILCGFVSIYHFRGIWIGFLSVFPHFIIYIFVFCLVHFLLSSCNQKTYTKYYKISPLKIICSITIGLLGMLFGICLEFKVNLWIMQKLFDLI